MTSDVEWPGVTMPPKRSPRDHIEPLTEIFHDLRRHAELSDAMDHLAAAIRGVEAQARPERPTFATDFPARSAT